MTSFVDFVNGAFMLQPSCSNLNVKWGWATHHLRCSSGNGMKHFVKRYITYLCSLNIWPSKQVSTVLFLFFVYILFLYIAWASTYCEHSISAPKKGKACGWETDPTSISSKAYASHKWVWQEAHFGTWGNSAICCFLFLSWAITLSWANSFYYSINNPPVIHKLPPPLT